MIDESLLKSNFIGRDGFRWWIGQIPPVESWDEQANNNGWGNRYKVRILGYHPLDVSELPDNDLPWAQVMFSTTAGSGAAKYAVNPKLRPGDMVIGFFLDGDNAQIPVIMGALGHTSEWSTAEYKNPFVPFTGYTSRVSNPKSSGRIKPDESNEATKTSQQTPRAVPPEVAARLKEISAYTGIGREVVFADTCGDSTIKGIKTEVNNLLKDIQQAQGKISEYQQKIRQVAEVIKSYASWIVGRMMDAIYTFLVGDYEQDPPIKGIIPEALKALYNSVYGAVFAATGNPAAAHTAGYKSNEVFVTPIKVLEQALSCVANAIVEGLLSLIIQLLESLLENVDRVLTCVAEQFVGSLVNSVIDAVADGLSGALGGVSALLGGFGGVVDFLSSTAETIIGLGGLFDCNQSNKKCDGVKEWIVGAGPKSSLDSIQSFNNIFDISNAIGGVEGVAGFANVFSDEALRGVLSGITGCIPSFPTTCGSPIINIFGGGGSGATALPILGAPILSDSPINNVTQTASIIGAVITNRGSGYRFPPFVEITDSCGLGYGARGQAVLNDVGEVIAIYMNSAGESYPIAQNQPPYGIIDTIVLYSGLNYSSKDTATDNFGNTYSLTVDDGRIVFAIPLNIVEVTDTPVITINTQTGTGAVLKPIFGPISQPSETQKLFRDIVGIQTSIDCPV